MAGTSPTADRSSTRRRTLWSVCLIVVLALAALLAFQYRALVKLEHTSAIAHTATLENYAEAVVKEVEYAYVWRAERSLNLPSYLFQKNCLVDMAKFFQRKKLDGVKRFFIVSYLGAVPGALYFFDPENGAMEEVDPNTAAEARATLLATVAWQEPTAGSRLSSSGFYVGNLDHGNPVIFNPIRTSESELVGLAGMIVDREHFETKVLPAAIAEALPPLSDRDLPGRDRLLATVRDAEGRSILPTTECDLRAGQAQPPVVERELTFVFANWTLGLRGKYGTPDELARSNFLMNVTLSVALAALLLGAVVLALRTAAREMKLSGMKNDFVSNVSHELKTPLASIRVFGELLRLGKIDQGAKVREFGEYIENESRRLTQLVNNILDFSKIDSGRRVYRFEPASVEEVVAESLKAYEVALEHYGVRIAVTPPASPIPRLAIDFDALVQAVSNLIDNAVKYSGDHRPEVAVTLEAAGDGVVIRVADRGIGIAPDEQERIFERFHRVGTGLVHDVKGSGLGLSIVRHIVESHGGRVTVSSRPGKGSTFAIHLPVPRPSSAEGEAREASVAAAKLELETG